MDATQGFADSDFGHAGLADTDFAEPVPLLDPRTGQVRGSSAAARQRRVAAVVAASTASPTRAGAP